MSHPVPTSDPALLDLPLGATLDRVMESFRASSTALRNPGPVPSPDDLEEVVEAVFTTLTSRRFAHLGRSRSEPYREGVSAHLRSDVAAGRPVRFYYDLGPGYRASLEPGRRDLSFAVGLGELLALRQIVLFSRRIAELYSPGAQFWLVIDDLCGRATNDILPSGPRGYVESLRHMVSDLGLADRVSLLVESELNSWETYRRRLDEEPTQPPAPVDERVVENVARFLGRPCDASEAAARVELYRRTGRVTEDLLAPAIHGVRLTQRATANTLGFRSFPGGDQRIQVGEVGLAPDSRGRLRPLLVTSRNAGGRELQWLPAPDTLPAPVRKILIALLRED